MKVKVEDKVIQLIGFENRVEKVLFWEGFVQIFIMKVMSNTFRTQKLIKSNHRIGSNRGNIELSADISSKNIVQLSY